MRKIRVGILFGGVSGEHEVSLMSARSILQAISSERYDVVSIGVSHTGHWLSGEKVLEHLENGRPEMLSRVFMFPVPDQGRLYRLNGGSFEFLSQLDVIFPVLHGSFGEDGNLQGYLELMDIPYVGSNVSSSSICMEKGLFKDIMRAQDMPVVDMFVVSRSQVESSIDAVVMRAESSIAYPMFVKPVNLGSSVGVNRCRHRAELIRGLQDASQYSQKIAIERGVDAWEIEVSVLGNEKEMLVSIPGEVRYRDEFYSYKAKYFDKDTELVIPAPLEKHISEEIRRIAGRVYQAVGCEGMARVDFLVEKNNGKIYVNELNTIPGFTHASMYPRLWEYTGIAFEQLIDRLIELAFERHRERKRTNYRYVFPK